MLLENFLLHLLAGWAPAFRQKRTCERAIALALGLLCGLGRRTVTRAICFNNRQHRDWTADYKAAGQYTFKLKFRQVVT